LFNYLAGLNADNVEKIELITTPGAGMDAQGNAGFINIVLKKGKNEGVYGSVGGGFGVGSGTVGNLSGDITYNKDRLSLNANYAFSRQAQRQHIDSYRKKISNPSDFSLTGIVDRHRPVQANHNLYLGANYRISGNSSIGVAITAYSNKYTMTDEPTYSYLIINNVSSHIDTRNDETNHWQHIGGNINFSHTFKAGRTLSASFDYLYYDHYDPVSYFQKYYDAANQLTDEIHKSSSVDAPIRIAVGKIDYAILKNNKWTINSGLKATHPTFDDHTKVGTKDPANGTFVTDSAFTSFASLRETILAAYTEATYQINEKWSIKAGLRYEHTKDDMGAADSLNRNYGNLFPSVVIDYKINDKSNISFTYAKRISRPALTDLAPFFYMPDPYSMLPGNPALQASTSHNIGINFSIGKLILSSTYSLEADALSQGFVMSVDTVKNIGITRSENLGDQKTFNTTAILQTRVTGFWSMQNTISGIWKELKTNNYFALGTLGKWGFTFSSTQSFKLPHSFTAEISGWYNSASLFDVGLMRNVGALDAGVKKSIGKSDLSLNYTNILNTNTWMFTGNHLGYAMRAALYFSYPTVKLSYTLKLGRSDNNAKFNKSNSAEEERGRVR
jgi:outer membrane receptor protein involved in Fe transport